MEGRALRQRGGCLRKATQSSLAAVLACRNQPPIFNTIRSRACYATSWTRCQTAGHGQTESPPRPRRARRITTTYGYNAAGELTNTVYSDSTPAVAAVYDRRGRRTSVTFGTNTVHLGYNNAGQLTNEAYTAGILANISVISGYDNLLRRTSLQVSGSSFILPPSSFSYDNASRLSSVSDGPNSAVVWIHGTSTRNLPALEAIFNEIEV